MEYKYKSKIMNNNLFKSTNLIKLVLFMFLVISINQNTYAQCITPSGGFICYGDSTDLCVTINNNVSPSFTYIQDFEVAPGIEWNTSSMMSINSTTVLGNFDNESVTLSLNALPVHDSITVEFDLYILDSWDGNSTLDGPDFFTLRTDGIDMMHTTFSNVPQYDQSYPQDYSTSNLFQTGALIVNSVPSFALYKISKTIAHVNANAVIDFIGGPGLENIGLPGNESWAIDNVSLKVFNFSTVTWTDITNNSFISSDTCITVNPIMTTDYQVVIDSSGTSLCIDTVTITVNPEINITATVNDNSSQNACNGSIFSTVTGGSVPYTYQWDTSNVPYPGNTPVIQNLCENTYCLTVTDSQGCIEDSCFNVEWNPCDLNVSIIDSIDCNGGTGAFQITADTSSNPNPLPYNGQRFIYTIYTTNPLTQFSQQFNNSPSLITASNYPAGDYLISVYDKSWGDSCYTNITLIEPDPILIYTTVDSASASWVNDGSILIDSITGGVGGNSWIWFDSSYVQSPPGNPILFDSLLLDSIYFSHEYYGGYTISVTDLNGCLSDTTLYVYPILTLTSFATQTIIQHETCWGDNDGIIHGIMNDSAVPPFTYYWIDVDGSMLNPGDTMRVDCFGCPPPSNYNPSHIATHTNLAPGCYSLSATDAFGNESFDLPPLCIDAADSIYVIIEPDLDSVTLNCSEERILSAIANPLPAVAQLMPDTQLIANNSGNTTFTLDFNTGTVNGATFSLYDSPNRTYYIECTGTLTDTSIPPLNYDAAFMDWPTNPTAQNSIWSWNNSNGGSVPLLNSSLYDGVNHSYIWNFPANSNSAVQNLLNPNLYDHEFFVNTTIISGQLDCQVFGVVDTIIYDYVWTTVANPGVVLSTSDTLLTDSSIVITTDYVVTITNTNGCVATDTIRVNKDLNTLALDSVLITPVRPCYGDVTGEIHIDVVDSSGIQPFTYFLYDVDTNFIQSTSDTFFTGLVSGDYVIQVQDTIGCLNPFALVYIDQPDTIFACGVDLLNDTTFNVFTHTVIANDPSTWNFQMGILAPNFQYYLEIDSTFGLFTIQANPPYDQDAAFNDYDGLINSNPLTGVPIPGPWWTVDADVLRPDIDVYNPTHTYIYHSPSDVNGGGLQADYFTGTGNTLNFEFFGLNNPSGDTIKNQGGLRFRLHKIACTQTDTAFTCKGEGLGFAYVRPQSVNGNLGGIPYAGPDGIVGDLPGPDGILGNLDDLPTGDDDYYETAWIKYNPLTGANIDTIQGGPGAGASDTIVNLFAGSYRVVVIDSLGCSEFVRYLEVVEPIDTFRAELDTVMPVLCKYDNSGSFQVSNFGGFDSIATNGSAIVPIASTTSRYAVLLKDNSVFNACDDINSLPQANYVDTILTLTGVLDSIIFDSLFAGRYQLYIYDSLPDATYGQYDPLTGDILTTPFNYMMCPEIIEVYIQEPCDSLNSSTTLLTNVKCWGDTTAMAFVQAVGGANAFDGMYSYQWDNAPFGISGVGEVGDTAYNLWADTTFNAFPNALWHTVTISDTNGCTLRDSIEIEHINRKIRPFHVVNAPVDTIFDIQFIEDSLSCFGVCDGEVALQSLGGVYPHEYVWDTDPFTTVYNQPDTMSALCEGGHDVLITDGVGCQERVRFRIYEPDQIFANGSLVSPISCFGANDGVASVLGAGGNNLNGQNSYNFTWIIDSITYNINDSLIGVGSSLDSIPPGIHVVTVTDYKGCTASDTIEFIEPTKLYVVIVDSLTQYAYCEYTESAKLCAQAFGGTPGYVYQWDDAYLSNNSNNALVTGIPFCAENLTAVNVNSIDGSYNVFVVDDRGCFADTTINIDTITNTFNVNSIITTTTHVSCFGGFDGAIDIIEFKIIDSTVFNNITLVVDTFYQIITLPNPAYSFTWTGPAGYSQTTQNISTLYAGSYAVIVEDTNGCRRTKNIEVYQPDQLYYNIYSTIDATCVGDGFLNTPPTAPPSEGSCDGQIMVNVTGGTWPYYYDVDEANTFPIGNPLQLINDTLIDDLCFGIHNIYLTDANDCEGQVKIGGVGVTNIGEGVVVTVPGVNTVETTCSYSADGTATLQFPGVDPLFNYTWETNNPGPPPVPSGTIVSTTVPSFDGFYKGDYWVIAHYTDAANFGQNYDGCDAIQSFTITGPTPIIPGQSFTEPDCWDEENGTITLNPSGGTPGTPPYTYLWDNTVSLPNGSSSISENALYAGTYGITIIDGNGCDTTITVEVTQPDQLQNDFTIIDVDCNGNTTGKAIPVTFGGTGAGTYNYDWGTNDPNALTAGTYFVTIEDASGCEIEDTAIVGEPNPLVINDFVVIEPLCYGGDDGQVTAILEGGTGPYNYVWSDGDVNPNNPAVVTNISEGTLTLNITDAKGCTIVDDVPVYEPTEIDDNAKWSIYGVEDGEILEVSCKNANDGWISLNPTGGVPLSNGAYTYQWTGSSSSDSVASNLSEGDYYVDITDANNCTYTFNYYLDEPNDVFEATVSTVNYSGPTNPPFSVLFIDSTAFNMGTSVQESWTWINGEGIVGAAINSGEIGEFTFPYTFDEIGLNNVYVIVTNTSTGCEDTVSFTIAVQGIPDINNVFSPNGDGTNDEFMFDEFGVDVISVEIYNRWGQLVNNWTDINKGWDGRGPDGQELPEGVYFYVLTADGEDGYYYNIEGTVTLLR
jgi:gliding motility-associated-like protein